MVKPDSSRPAILGARRLRLQKARWSPFRGGGFLGFQRTLAADRPDNLALKRLRRPGPLRCPSLTDERRNGVETRLVPNWDLIDRQREILADSGVFSGAAAGLLRDLLRTRLVWSSNAIEGYAYTEGETNELLESGLTADRPLKDALAVIGLSDGHDHMFSLMRASGVAEADLLLFHKFLGGSLHNEAEAGEWRKFDVMLTGVAHAFPGWKDVPALMEGVLERHAARRGDPHPARLAAELHADFVNVHPFGDGNGRVARLAMNTVLLQNGMLPVAVLPGKERNGYMRRF